MPNDSVVIALRPEQFSSSKAVLARCGGLSASGFRYRTGVAGLRIANEVGHLVLLPFQGQQIWDAFFYERTLTMRSMFEEPVETDDYLRTYGGFLIHCGASAMGVPGPDDRHPLHGELPNARYQEAELVVGQDEAGTFMRLAGCYHHTVAFAQNYLARPTVTLHSASARVKAEMRVTNLKRSQMELMYLAHFNFRPVDHARLVDTVPDGPRHMRVRSGLPPQFTPSPAYLRLLDALAADPSAHRIVDPALVIDPELVISLDCRADEDGWAHSMQLHPNGAADFVSHRPDELDHGVRWICRSVDQDAMGILLPATAEADGYTAEKAKGNVRTIPPQGEFRCRLEFGALSPPEAEEMKRRIGLVMSRARD